MYGRICIKEQGWEDILGNFDGKALTVQRGESRIFWVLDGYLGIVFYVCDESEINIFFFILQITGYYFSITFFF